MLNDIFRHIFNEHDDAILNYLQDDNQKIEPEYYVPIIPMVLVNGADGIGTGWMTKIPNFNPRYGNRSMSNLKNTRCFAYRNLFVCLQNLLFREIIENLRRLIRGQEPKEMIPWFKNFKVNPMVFSTLFIPLLMKTGFQTFKI
jgi:DNA topoisomerase-2